MGAHKPALHVGGRPIVERVLSAARGLPTVVVGLGEGVPAGVPVVREEPPGSGPVAGIAAGLAALDALAEAGTLEAPLVVLVLAGDLPFVTAAALAHLVAALGHLPAESAGPAAEVAVAVGPGGSPNWLCAAWRVPALRRCLTAMGDPSGRSVRRLTSGARTVLVADDHGWSGDVDDPADLEAARRRVTD